MYLACKKSCNYSKTTDLISCNREFQEVRQESQREEERIPHWTDILSVLIILPTDSLILFSNKLVSDVEATDASKYAIREGRSSGWAFNPGELQLV